MAEKLANSAWCIAQDMGHGRENIRKELVAAGLSPYHSELLGSTTFESLDR